MIDYLKASRKKSSGQGENSHGPLALVSGYFVYYGLIAIGLFILLFPVLIVIGISFNPTEAEIFPPNGFSLTWYEAFFQDDRFVSALFTASIPIALVSALIATIVGVLAAYVLVFTEIPFKTEIQTFLVTPLIFPAVILGLSILLFLSLIDVDLGHTRIIFGHALVSLPFTTLLAAATLQSIDRDLELAAQNLGASKFQAFRKITLPLMKSGVVSGYLFAFIISFTDVNISLFLAEGTTTTLPVEIFLFLRWNSTPIIAVAATLSILVVLILILLIGRFIGFKAVVEDTRR